jgi:uncharacterized protein (DUF983 family)
VSERPSNPWGALEPSTPDTAAALFPDVGSWATLMRGLAKRCPRCNVRGIFAGWFTLRASCPRCDLRFEKEEGGYLGAMVLNFAVAMVLWLGVIVVGLILTVPDVPIAPLLAASFAVLMVGPLLFYPNSKAIWAAVEFLVLRTDPDYRAPAARDPRARELE